ncbi:MAG: methyltransferase domain-containing protein [Planctomycetia bacterium]
MHLNSRLMFEKYGLGFFRPGMRVLEIGPDSFPSTLRSAIQFPDIVWDTMDMYQSPKLTHVNISEYTFPISDETYDVVVTANVAEHVAELWTWMAEVARVCRRGGLVVTVNPVSYPYHEAPIDCYRIYPEGMKAVYRSAGLTVEHSCFESLEIPANRRRLPGVSTAKQSRARRIVWGLLGVVGFPVECAFDAITIGRKPV